jgi:hypothetical protein
MLPTKTTTMAKGHNKSNNKDSTAPIMTMNSNKETPLTNPSLKYVDGPLLCEFLWKQEKEKNEDSVQETYEEYRKRYCLNYIRSFFNKHLDDSWFRRLYSPGVQYQTRVQERQRRLSQAKAILDATQSNTTRDDFLTNVRLSGGIKGGPQHHQSIDKLNRVRTSHLLAVSAIHVTDIPHFVTDSQILNALHEAMYLTDDEHERHNNQDNALELFPTSNLSMVPHTILQRDVIVVGNAKSFSNILHKLRKSSKVAVPRKHSEKEPLLLEVECSDPYGREQVDNNNNPNDSILLRSNYPLKATVQLEPLDETSSLRTIVLSAAVSSETRIEPDKEAAITIAMALDAKLGMEDVGIQKILESLSSSNPSLSPEMMLDVAIAYLRRVHLFCFYTAESCHNFADFLIKHNVIYLRLENADAILKASCTDQVGENDANNTNDNNINDILENDLLVQRLDKALSMALEQSQEWEAQDYFQDVKQAAMEIQQLEKEAESDWLRDHCILDDDNRARCAFRFCHKLFKDVSFLYKHLLKKHKEYLLAEQAKCHDAYMMQNWDGAEERLCVPPILVDCGARFGTVSTPIFGRDPDCVDPEPELWKREEEFREQREKREAAHHPSSSRPFGSSRPRDPEMTAPPPQLPPRVFVDVDDMKEEKVELNFENIEVPEPVIQKKKKRRKLL